MTRVFANITTQSAILSLCTVHHLDPWTLHVEIVEGCRLKLAED